MEWVIMEGSWIWEYVPELYSVSGIMLYSFFGYVLAILLGYFCSQREYTMEDYREAVRRNRKNEKVVRPFG